MKESILNTNINREEPVKTISTHVPAHIYYQYTNKIKFYDLNSHDVMGALVQKFIKGDFDEDFSIPKD